MKKILIALPLVLIMLLSMVPVMAAEQAAVLKVTYYNNKNLEKQVGTETVGGVTVDTELSAADRLVAVEAMVRARTFPSVDGTPGSELDWEVKVVENLPYIAKGTKLLKVDEKGTKAATQFSKIKEAATKLGITITYKDNVVPADDANITQSAFDKLEAAYNSDAKTIEIDNAKDIHSGDDAPELYPFSVEEQAEEQPAEYVVTAYARGPKPTEAPAETTTAAPAETTTAAPAETTTAAPAETTTEAPAETTTEKLTCPEACEFITVELRDIHSGRNLAWASKQFKVNNKVAPDFDAILDLYLDQYFPWGNWQPVKNYLNVYSIITPKDIFDCKIVIEVIPKWENIMVIHELWDCCITPDGKVKEELRRSFIEDNKRYETWDPNFIDPATGRTVLSGNSSYGLDGLLPIDFLDFHTDLKVNQEKAAEYAKTRLEKMNAADFVFQHATFYENVRVSNYFTGDVYDLDGNLVTTWTDGIPTIVIKYLRAECIKTDEKVDDAKVVAGQAGTTTTPVQQLPATGAKDVTAFFMSAVALLGLGIFFAKKR